MQHLTDNVHHPAIVHALLLVEDCVVLLVH
jgi:hypothetical protein